MIDLGELGIKLKVDDSGGIDGLKQFGDNAENTGGKLDGLLGKLKGLAVGLAIGATIKKGFDIAKQAVTEFADKGDDIDKMSQKFSMSAEAYQQWESIAGHNGTSIETVGKAIKEITTSAEDNAEAYENMGISMKNTDGSIRDSQSIFKDTILALSDMKAGTERDAKAKELLGNKYQELLPLINGGKDAILEQLEASESAVTMTDEQVKSAAAFKDAQQAMEEQITKVKMALTEKLIPALVNIMDWVSEYMPQIQETVDTVVSAIGGFIDGLVAMISALVTSAQTEGTLFNTVWENMKIVVDTVLKGIQALFGAFTALFNGDFEGFLNGINDFLNIAIEGLVKLIANSSKLFLNAGKSIFTSLWDGLKQVWDGIKKWVDEKVSWLTDKVTFWKKKKSEMGNDSDGESDGSHRNGLAYVPYDEYKSVLHKGEMVLTQAEADRYRNDETTNKTENFTVNIAKVENSNGRTTGDLMREMEFYRKSKKLATGGA
ncbi:hypothetical protein CLNEO_13440 [Anaerotignum neopropionicum]|uniref:Phage-related minor tail protein n=1 Tax=Anaerotignum neopropionicum TaxID=36847 RepID=A0A136WG43_9FIRM|nr:phage tail tape measure protein [Anaerotignum neopropionicum]KXL53373.1 hypothetical protein CLNEO_13440 [Anaerotignum neopropionicum]